MGVAGGGGVPGVQFHLVPGHQVIQYLLFIYIYIYTHTRTHSHTLTHTHTHTHTIYIVSLLKMYQALHKFLFKLCKSVI